MKKSALLLTLLVSAQVCAEPANNGVWRMMKGQPLPGFNYQISNGGVLDNVDLSITCDPSDYLTIMASVDADRYGGHGYPGFSLIIDGTRYDNLFRLGDDFPTFWNALRNAKSLEIVTKNKQVSVPVTGLSNILPAIDAPNNYCRAREKRLPAEAPLTKGVWFTEGNTRQGYEYSVLAPTGYRKLTIACKPGEPVEMRLSLGASDYGTSIVRSDFGLIVDGQRFSAKNAVSEKSAFNSLWKALRSAKQLEVYTNDGQHEPLPIENIAKILPALGTSNFTCQTQEEHKAAELADDLANIEPLKNGDIQISKRLNPYYGSQSWNKYLIDITSRSDRMVITEMQINRGRCALSPKAKPPFRMGYGSKITLPVEPASCNPLEITITTLGGEQTFSFKQ